MILRLWPPDAREICCLTERLPPVRIAERNYDLGLSHINRLLGTDTQR